LDITGNYANTSINVINSLGQTIARIEQAEPENELNLEKEAAGVYFVTLTQNGKTLSVSKVIKH
jgi:hypothetical protein